MTPEQRRIKGNEARQLLENPMLKEAFAALDDYLNSAALSCNPDDAEKARRIVISKQLLAAVKREITRQIEDGVIADVQINELEQRRGLRRFMR